MITGARFEEIKRLCHQFDSLPDGAFFGVLAEHGVDADDLAAYADECQRRKKGKGQKARR